MGEALESLGWKALQTKPDKRWVAVKDCRVLPQTCPFKNMDDIHDWVREKIQYRPDNSDSWASPEETLARGYGDCEDFCILERALLLNAGFQDSDIEIMIVQDLVTSQTHALLWVKEHYSDNRAADILHVSSFKDYRPIQAHRADGTYLYGRVKCL